MAYDLQFTKRPFAPAEGSDGDDESDEETFADAFAARSKNIADKRPKTSKIATGPPGRGADTTTDDEWESLDQSACGFFRTGGNIKTAAEIRASGIERATELLRRLDRVTGNLYQPAAAAWLQTIRRGAADKFRDSFGVDDLKSLTKHYHDCLDHDVNFEQGVLADWMSLKDELTKDATKIPVEWRAYKPRKFWSTVMAALGDRYPYFMEIVVLYMLLPMDTSECERIFSLMNRLKTQVRNRLSNKRLNDLMICCRLCPPASDWTEDDIDMCIRRWLDGTKRGRYLTKLWV
jgi:hypothetical protein